MDDEELSTDVYEANYLPTVEAESKELKEIATQTDVPIYPAFAGSFEAEWLDRHRSALLAFEERLQSSVFNVARILRGADVEVEAMVAALPAVDSSFRVELEPTAELNEVGIPHLAKKNRFSCKRFRSHCAQA